MKLREGLLEVGHDRYEGSHKTSAVTGGIERFAKDSCEQPIRWEGSILKVGERVEIRERKL